MRRRTKPGKPLLDVFTDEPQLDDVDLSKFDRNLAQVFINQLMGRDFEDCVKTIGILAATVCRQFEVPPQTLAIDIVNATNYYHEHLKITMTDQTSMM